MEPNQVGPVFVICNPRAGGNQGAKRWERLQAKLTTEEIPFEFKMTEYPGHATEISESLLKSGWRRIGVLGGDGTLNEVINGLMPHAPLPPDFELIFLEGGSSCDFVKKLPTDKSPLERTKSRDSLRIDVCQVRCRGLDGGLVNRFFVNNSSIGVISLANRKFNEAHGLVRGIKRRSVDAAAIIAGLQAISDFQPIHADLVVDDEVFINLDMNNLTVFKTPYFGGGMNYGTDAKLDDGTMHAVWIEAVSKTKLLTMLPALYSGTVLKKARTHHSQCQTLEVQTNQDIFVEADGEIIGFPPASYSVNKQALCVSV